MKKSFYDLPALDSLIRKGNCAEVSGVLRDLASKKGLPRPERLDLAKLAYRASLPELGVKLLSPVVRSERKSRVLSTAEEKAEYGLGLNLLGAWEEALALLKTCEPNQYPRLLLYEASVHIHQWRYDEAIPLLEKFVLSLSVSSYDYLVGQINLAAALVHERRHDRALPLLKTIRQRCQREGNHLILAKALQFLAEMAIDQHELGRAESLLSEAAQLLKNSRGIDEFFVRKLTVFALCARAFDAVALRALQSIRDEARERRHWETVRECDRVLALATQDEALIRQLYIGTPHASYRERLLKDFGRPLDISRPCPLRLGGQSPSALDFELRPDHPLFGDEAIGSGSLLHRFLGAMTLDFYRPLRVATLHQALYPGEYYNPVSSPGRTHRAIQRFRQWCEKRGLPFVVIEEQGFYRLSARTPTCVWVKEQRVCMEDPWEKELGELSQIFGTAPFSAREARAVLSKLSPRSVARVLAHGVEQKRLERTGSSNHTQYRFLIQTQAQAA